MFCCDNFWLEYCKFLQWWSTKMYLEDFLFIIKVKSTNCRVIKSYYRSHFTWIIILKHLIFLKNYKLLTLDLFSALKENNKYPTSVVFRSILKSLGYFHYIIFYTYLLTWRSPNRQNLVHCTKKALKGSHYVN